MTLSPPPTLATLNPDPGGRVRALKWAVLCAGAAWLWERPTEAVPMLAAVLVGGPAFWFGLGPGWAKFKYHRRRAVRLIAWFASVGLVVFTMKKLVPLVAMQVAAAR